jgi:uroporphyrinogen III methyltransferase / synthase
MSLPRRVAVTRDEGPDGPLAQALRRRGLEPVPCAVVREAEPLDPEPLARVARELESFSWLVVASQRAVAALMEVRAQKPLPPSLRAAAVGARTAALLMECGASSPLTAAMPGAAPLIEILRDADRWPGRRVLIPRALGGRLDLAWSLRRFGARVDDVVAYRTLDRPPGEIATAWQAARPDAVVVASPSAARALVRAVGADTLCRLDRVTAIGTTTATELMALGVHAEVPARADFESVADLMAAPNAPDDREADHASALTATKVPS